MSKEEKQMERRSNPTRIERKECHLLDFFFGDFLGLAFIFGLAFILGLAFVLGLAFIFGFAFIFFALGMALAFAFLRRGSSSGCLYPGSRLCERTLCIRFFIRWLP